MAATSSDDEQVSRLQAEIARLKRANEKLKASNRRWMRIAGTDDLTGLPNRVFFTTALLPQQISQANAEMASFACLILAPDQLSEINQRFGREGGDEIVQGVANFLKDNLEQGERLVHFDGANFVILIPEGTLADAKRRGLALRARMVSRSFPCGDEGVNLTMSIGSVARSPGPPRASVNTKKVIDTLIRKLANALGQAKKKGRDNLFQDTDTDF